MQIIIYISRAKQNFTSGDLADLRDLADAGNRSEDITGLLLSDGARFIQALEGDAAAVQAVMDRIAKDSRHDNISYFRPITTNCRQFRKWTTEYLAERDLGEERGFLDRVMRHVAYVECDSIKAVFIGFAALSLSRRLTF
ncbi:MULTISPECIES: BLUF domain-containing protein [Sphingomonas]|uniref:BLUF domain-containing protein n=1 Tax=Sphingomonas TaxID=13687 RepID=UPI00208F2501|nr:MULTISPECIES: BLUF domain-containing protein [Sphingomonas]MDY0968652.1 BLUF domain-containing protein [Sphingomonas sp. CFBP9021]USR00088.1 BLUF domain-containing protein [Sphingomonas aerolata]